MRISELGRIFAAAFIGLLIFFPISALSGQPEEQKTVYVAHDLELLIETAASLPENTNFLLPDSLGASAELYQGKLIVEGPITVTPELQLPNNIATNSQNKVPIDFLYVTKTANTLGLTSVKNTECLKVPTSAIFNSKINIEIIQEKDVDKSKQEELKKNVLNLLKSRYRISEDDKGLKIILMKGSEESILINNGNNRIYSSLTCFIAEKTQLKRSINDYETNSVTITITENTDASVLANNIVQGIEAYYE